MKKLNHFTFLLLLLFFPSIGMAGPTVVPHEKKHTVKVWDSKFALIQELKAPNKIKEIQNIFRRSIRVGDTSSHLQSYTHTHKVDFSDRWLLNLTTGEMAVLSKAVVPVYQIQAKDLKQLRKLIETQAE